MDATLSVGYQDAYEAIQGDQVRPLSDLCNIEAALELIKRDEEKISHYKELKKKRAEQIDKEVQKITARIDHMKNVILQTLEDNKEKNVSFPGVGKVAKGSTQVKWEITDEEKLLAVLKARKEFDNCVKTEYNIAKKELNKLLGMWDKSGEVPKECIEKIPASTNLRITFDKEIDLDATPDIDDVPVPKKDAGSLDFTN